jgi:hypothetical protein
MGVFNLRRHGQRDVFTGLRVRDGEGPLLPVDILLLDASALPGPDAGQQTEQKISALHWALDVIPCGAPLLEVLRRKRDLSGLLLIPLNRRSRGYGSTSQNNLATGNKLDEEKLTALIANYENYSI